MTTRRGLSMTPRRQTGYRSAPMSLRNVLLAAFLLSCLCVPSAHAASDQISIVMDDDQFLYRGDRTAARTLTTARSLGAEAVRVSVLWRVVAEGANLSNAEIARLKGSAAKAKARKQRARFMAGNPRTYPTRNWDRYDNLVKTATRLGMRVLFTVTGPGPRFGHQLAPLPSQRANAGTYKPYPSRFRSFVQAVGRATPAATGTRTASAARCRASRCGRSGTSPTSPAGCRRSGRTAGRPASPALYRELFQAGRQGLAAQRPRRRRRPARRDRAAGLAQARPAQRDPPDAVPARARLRRAQRHAVHRRRRDRAPLRRLREDRPAEGARLRPPPVHEEGRSDGGAGARPDEITIANIGTLGRQLDALSAQSGGKIPANMPILLTEFGYESNPPDPRNGISLHKQASTTRSRSSWPTSTRASRPRRSS